MSFHKTRTGKKFFENDFPKMVKALERIATALERKSRRRGHRRHSEKASAGAKKADEVKSINLDALNEGRHLRFWEDTLKRQKEMVGRIEKVDLDNDAIRVCLDPDPATTPKTEVIVNLDAIIEVLEDKPEPSA